MKPKSDYGNRTEDGLCTCLNPRCPTHDLQADGLMKKIPCREDEIILCGFCDNDRAQRGPCKFRGERTNETIQCTTCNGNVRIRLFECEIHKRCSIKKPVGFQCCWNCKDHKEK